MKSGQCPVHRILLPSSVYTYICVAYSIVPAAGSEGGRISGIGIGLNNNVDQPGDGPVNGVGLSDCGRSVVPFLLGRGVPGTTAAGSEPKAPSDAFADPFEPAPDASAAKTSGHLIPPFHP